MRKNLVHPSIFSAEFDRLVGVSIHNFIPTQAYSSIWFLISVKRSDLSKEYFYSFGSSCQSYNDILSQTNSLFWASELWIDILIGWICCICNTYFRDNSVGKKMSLAVLMLTLCQTHMSIMARNTKLRYRALNTNSLFITNCPSHHVH